MSFVADAKQAQNWHAQYGMSMFFIASEHSWMRNGARSDAQAVHAIK